MSILTEQDKVMFRLLKDRRADIVTQWYFKGWKPLLWQYQFMYAPQLDLTVVNGIATGKTTAAGVSGFLNAMSIPYYRVMNTSITAKQSELPFEMLSAWIEDNDRLQRHIKEISLRPFPTISFHNGSEYSFRTSGTDGRFIRGFEYDEINMDEGGYELTGEVSKVLRGRLRGTRPDGVTRRARFSVITTPTEAPWLRARFDLGLKGSPTYNGKLYHSWRVETFDNIHLTKAQIAQIKSTYTDVEVDIEMRGMFPDHGLTTFPSGNIREITRNGQPLYDEIYQALNPDKGSPLRGHILEEHPRHGITKYEVPHIDGIYVLAGDPGVDSPPKRNAGVVMVMRTDVYPNRIVYFDWVDGKGSYDNFLKSFAYANMKYRPRLRLMDTTGTQKAIGDLIKERHNVTVDHVKFSHSKEDLINALSLDVSNQDIVWPPIRGLINQMSSYKRENDRYLNQDIVMTLGMLSWAKRYAPDTQPTNIRLKKRTRKSRNARGRRAGR